MSKIYVGDVGDIIRVNANPQELPDFDISGANALSILVLKPDKSTVEWVGAQYIDPVTGPTSKIQYTTQEGDFDLKGTYKLQAYVAWDIPESGHKGETVSIKVYEAFK